MTSLIDFMQGVLSPQDDSSNVPSLHWFNKQLAAIRLNRPKQRNRLEHGDLVILNQHCEAIDATQGICAILICSNTFGQPKPVFSAGYHIGNFDSQEHQPDLFGRTIDRIAALKAPVICALNGSVYGGATDLVLACDLRLGLRHCEFRMPAAALGLHYYPSGLRRYHQAFGLNAAKWAFLSARAITTERLYEMSVLMGLSEQKQFINDTHDLANNLLALAPLATQGMKASLNEIAAGSASIATLMARGQLTASSKDFSEGRLAFLERRVPRFIGQ